MAKQLNVRSDEAYETARRIARRLNLTTSEVVVTALRRLDERTAAAEPDLSTLTPEQRARYDALMTLARKGARLKPPGVTSDHRDMYDEYGLPK